MKRFIQHEELARDSRFIRQQNVMTTVLASLPDDVDKVVEVFDQFAPMIEEGTRGTAAWPLFEKFGPAFALVTLNEPIVVPDDLPMADLLRRALAMAESMSPVSV